MTNKYMLRGYSEDAQVKGTLDKAREKAQQMADRLDEYIEVWPDPSNDDYRPLCAAVALPKEGK